MSQYTIFNSSRTKKAIVTVNDDGNVLNEVLSRASRLFKIKGKSVVCDSDGMPIDNDLSFDCLSDEIFMVLGESEKWTDPASNNENDSNVLNQEKTSPSPNKTKNSDHPAESDHQDKNTPSPSKKSKISDQPAGNDVDVSVQVQNVSTLKKPYSNFKDFKISWSKFDYNLRRQLDKGCTKKITRKSVLNGIVNELRVINHRIPEAVLQDVATTLVQMYPKTFADSWKNGKRQGDGTSTIISTMRDRNNYLNRPHMDPNNLSSILKVPLKKQKLIQSIPVGCPQWQPSNYEENVTEEIAEEHRQYLLRYKEYDLDDETQFQKCLEALSSSFPLQRLFLNNVESPPTVSEIECAWPCLLHSFYLMVHFSMLTECVHGDMMDAIKEDVPLLLAYGQLKKYVDINEVVTEHQRNVAAIRVIFQYFDEDFKNVFPTLPVSYIIFSSSVRIR